MTPEGRVTERIKRFLQRQDELFFWKVFGNGMQKRGMPDLNVCYRGYYVAIEVKAPGKDDNVSDAQADKIRRIQEAGGYAIVADDVNRVDAMLTLIDSRIAEIDHWKGVYRAADSQSKGRLTKLHRAPMT